MLLRAAVLLLAVSGTTLACTSDDTGVCCKVLPGRDVDIPMPTKNADGEFIDDITRHPAFDCSNLTCVTYLGSAGYCTKKCVSADTCPEGFLCQSVLQSDPGPDSDISPDDKFCVRPEPEATCE